MNLTRLRYFVTVADELHFGRAAERLHMAQPPLSQQIRLLEKELGTELFVRTTRRVELTAAGALLLDEALPLLQQADALERLMAEQGSSETVRLRVGFVDSSSYAVMPQLLRAYRERWPAAQFELHTMSSEAQRHALLAGTVDLGIARTRGDEPGLVSTVILDEALYVAVSSGHALARRKSTTLSQLRGEAFIGFTRNESPALTAELQAMLSGAGADYDPIIEAEEYTTIVGLVAAGEGIAVVPDSVRSFAPPNLVYLRLRDAAARSRLMLLTREGERLQSVRRALTLATDLFPR